MADDAAGYNPIPTVAFDTDAPEFCRGWQAGVLYAELRDSTEPHEQWVFGTNAEMILRIAEATGRDLVIEEHEYDWMLAKFGPKKETA